MQENDEKCLGKTIRLAEDKVLNYDSGAFPGIMDSDKVLVTLVAGKGTRFGKDPKCIQPVNGVPLAKYSIDSFRKVFPSPVICIVGYRNEDVRNALGKDNIYVMTDNPAGGTAFAAIESFSVPGLLEKNPLVFVSMGDRIVPPSVFQRLYREHTRGDSEAMLTFLSAIYEPPKNEGKGRVLRDANGKVIKIVEEKDILAVSDELKRRNLFSIMEGNCPLYLLRASVLYSHTFRTKNNNAQEQYYLTDIIGSVSGDGGEIRTVTTSLADAEYDLLTSDVTRPMDLALLEGILSTGAGLFLPEDIELENTARQIINGRPSGQVDSLVRQMEDLLTHIRDVRINFEPDKPVGIGITGGRLRIAFMHPDMSRFFGPAWQMPIGAGSRSGDEQIMILIQSAEDGRIHLIPHNQQYRENINSVPADNHMMYPGEDVSDITAYERFGTHMSENLLLSLGYFSDSELAERRKNNLPVPPSSLWVSSNMRRPFALVGNALASIRTLRTGNLGARVREYLGYENFRGLKIVSTGNIPQGGFSSSSAVTVATKNAINALYNIGIPSDLLVHLACQAEYGTGVRAGSLDQATEQKGQAGQGTLISSNPRDNYKILGTWPIPENRIHIIFPYSVERDRNSWRWSAGVYAESQGSGKPTTTEIRKMTGKAAEIAAILIKLPVEEDFFRHIEDDLVIDGSLNEQNIRWICGVLLKLPLCIKKDELRSLLLGNKDWYAEQLAESLNMDPEKAAAKAETTIDSLFEGWNDPLLRRTDRTGKVVEETGVPLRAIAGYLFGEVAKNFYMINNQEEWIDCVTSSQRGDCSYMIDPSNLPEAEELENISPWEKEFSGPDLLNEWLKKIRAQPVDYNKGLYDSDLAGVSLPEFHRLQGSSFFRGLALIDMAEAMLKRAFGSSSVAVRVNAAGQGDYFQVHIDRQKADPERVKDFLRNAFYKRFGITPGQEFVEIYAGGGASGARLERFDQIPALIDCIKRLRNEN